MNYHSITNISTQDFPSLTCVDETKTTKLAKTLEVDMNFSVVAPVNDKRESKKPQTYTIEKSLAGISKKRLASPAIEDECPFDGNPGPVEPSAGDHTTPDSPGIPVPERTFQRVKRVARRLDDTDDEGASTGAAQAPPVTASDAQAPQAPPVTTSDPPAPPAVRYLSQAEATALPIAVAVEYIPRNADNAVMHMEIERIEARCTELDKRLAELQETNRLLTSNQAGYQAAYAQIEARLKERDEVHAQITKLKEEKYLAIISENAERFMILANEKDNKYNDMFNAYFSRGPMAGHRRPPAGHGHSR